MENLTVKEAAMAYKYIFNSIFGLEHIAGVTCLSILSFNIQQIINPTWRLSQKKKIGIVLVFFLCSPIGAWMLQRNALKAYTKQENDTVLI
ncbi:hypothetical protein GCM10023331_39790 [Algivirga pacifica]|uniref:Uncharacterized protein n=1 Tax=Algivirga pacifica TaxID=1162670 RepID=A0ABP9DLA1_9BACT